MSSTISGNAISNGDSLAKNDIRDRISIDEIKQEVCSIRFGFAAAGALY